MYLVEIVETATSEQLYKNPRHPPYSPPLLSSVPLRLTPRLKSNGSSTAGGCAEPRESAEWLPLPSPLPNRDGNLLASFPKPLDLDGHIVRCHAVEQEEGSW